MMYLDELFRSYMDAFSPTPPSWTDSATHAMTFCCPVCKDLPSNALQVWINRSAPVMTEDRRRKWQEFYQCQCTKVWWAWSLDRLSLFVKSETSESGVMFIDPIDDDWEDAPPLP